LVGLIILLVTGAGEPFQWECPETVNAGEPFSLRITTTEPGCSGISASEVTVPHGVIRIGSSTFTSISSVTTPQGRQLTQEVVLELLFSASGRDSVTIGPIQLYLHGIGRYTLNPFTVAVNGTSGTASAGTQGSEPQSSDIWLTGTLHDPEGKIYPGTRLVLDYYVYSRVAVEDVTYWWGAPELGVIIHVETFPNSNWENDYSKHDNTSRSILAEVEMAPAAPGSLLAPVFTADITGEGFNIWGKALKWTIESDPVVLPVYPFPNNPPENWDETLLDSVSVRIEQLPTPPGQGGELSLRLTCNGPGNVYMEDPPVLTLNGNAVLIQAGKGSAGNKKWWDFILEPEETGTCVIGPDSVVWLNRRNSTYQTAVIEPCSVCVVSIPWADRKIELDESNNSNSSISWIVFALAGVLFLTVKLGYTVKQKNTRLASVTSAEDMDELLSGLENELSRTLTGKKEYLGYEELDELLSRMNTDSFLARRILRFWRDLEQFTTDREINGSAFNNLKSTAEELLYKLRNDLKSSKE
jgi:hypothetical protein